MYFSCIFSLHLNSKELPVVSSQPAEVFGTWPRWFAIQGSPLGKAEQQGL